MLRRNECEHTSQLLAFGAGSLDEHDATLAPLQATSLAVTLTAMFIMTLMAIGAKRATVRHTYLLVVGMHLAHGTSMVGKLLGAHSQPNWSFTSLATNVLQGLATSPQSMVSLMGPQSMLSKMTLSKILMISPQTMMP